jgi:ABC-type multidrug transport system fused ATPase/permease subunit
VFRAARPELPLLGGAAVALVVSSATTLIFPKAVGSIVDTIAPAAEPGASDEARAKARDAVKKMSAGLAAVFVVGAVTSFARVALLRLAGERLVARLRRQTFSALLAKDIAYFDARRSGDMLSKISADTVVLSKAFFECSAAARSAISMTGGVGLLLYISPPLTMLSLAVMPAVGIGAVLCALDNPPRVLHTAAMFGSPVAVGGDHVQTAGMSSACRSRHRQAWVRLSGLRVRGSLRCGLSSYAMRRCASRSALTRRSRT